MGSRPWAEGWLKCFLERLGDQNPRTSWLHCTEMIIQSLPCARHHFLLSVYYLTVKPGEVHVNNLILQLRILSALPRGCQNG